MIVKKLIAIAITIGLVFFSINQIGINDKLSLGLWIVITFLMFFAVIKIQIANREILRVYTKKDSILYKFLSGANFLTFIIAFIISVFSSVSLLLTFKVLSLSYGLKVVVFYFLASFVLIFLLDLSMKKVTSQVLKEEVSAFIDVYFVFIIALFFNLITTFVFSFNELNQFLHSNVNINNFEEMAIANKIDKTAYNEYSRQFINFYILIDFFKEAVANLFVDIFHIDKEAHKVEVFSFIYFINFFKFIGLSLGYVLLLKGVYDLVKRVEIKVRIKEDK